MSIVVTYDVQCDWPGCLLWADGAVGMIAERRITITASEARINAERRGFSRRRLPGGQMGDVCWEHRKVT